MAKKLIPTKRLIIIYLAVLSSLGQTGRFDLLASSPKDYFIVEVVDSQTGRGVPLVELRTVNKASWWTDSNGIVAYNEPGFDGKFMTRTNLHTLSGRAWMVRTIIISSPTFAFQRTCRALAT